MFHVYFVDDDPVLLDDISARNIWQECGFSVVGKTNSPAVALKEIPKLKPHLVLCDLKMPGMDGVSLMSQLKHQGVESEFVMLSAHASFADSRDFFNGQGFDYLLKPIDELELQITLERLSRRLFSTDGAAVSEPGALIENNSDEPYMLLSVADNGVGMQPDEAQKENPKGSHYGMKNIEMRLSLYFNQQISIIIESEEKVGTCVSVKLPVRVKPGLEKGVEK